MLRIQNGWLDIASPIKSPHFNARPHSDDISLIVIHNISLPPAEFGNNYVEQFFTGQLDASLHPYFVQIETLRVSAHFYVKRDGSLVQFVSVNDRAWHAGESCYQFSRTSAVRTNCNDFSIGIELAGTDDLPYTAKQYVRLAELTRILFAHYPKLSPEHIVGHCEIAPDRKTDPGASFDWQKYRDLLK